MRKEIDISPDYLLEDGDYIKVIDQKEDVETAKKGNGAIIFLLTCALAATIILCSTIVNISRKNNNDEKSFTNESETNRSVYRLAFSSCWSQRIAALRP